MAESDIVDDQSEFDSKMGFQRKDHTGLIQRYRGKQNIEYVSPQGESFFAKYCDLQDDGKRDNIQGMINEKKILDKLATTGVTPQAGEVKLYPNNEKPTKARFLIEGLHAVSLEDPRIGKDTEFASEMANMVLAETSKAYKTIHDKNVLQVDVNPGNILIQKADGKDELQARLVDFELAIDLDAASDKDMQAAIKWFSVKDKYQADGTENDTDVEKLKKSEINQWAMTMSEWLLGPSYTWKDLGEPSEESMTDEQKKLVEKLRAEAVQRGKRDVERGEQRGDKSHKKNEEWSINYELEHSFKYALAEAFLSQTLAERLAKKNLHIDENMLAFLTKALSTNLAERPASFDEVAEVLG
jgi:serine/threonine protein kinase